MKQKRFLFIFSFLILLGIAGVWAYKTSRLNPNYTVGQAMDSLNGVKVYYNGGIGNVSGRNVTNDNYNLGLKYQCVEFVKRYYYEALDHKMPDSYGNAIDFFNPELEDGQKNIQRDLIQYSNGSKSKPKESDLVIYNATSFNEYGHVAIVASVTENEVEIIQQNPGTFGNSRVYYKLLFQGNRWTIDNDRILGWLRK